MSGNTSGPGTCLGLLGLALGWLHLLWVLVCECLHLVVHKDCCHSAVLNRCCPSQFVQYPSSHHPIDLCHPNWKMVYLAALIVLIVLSHSSCCHPIGLEPPNLRMRDFGCSDCAGHYSMILNSRAASSAAHIDCLCIAASSKAPQFHQVPSDLHHKPSSHAFYALLVSLDQGFHCWTLLCSLTPSSWHASKPLQASLPSLPASFEHLIFPSCPSSPATVYPWLQGQGVFTCVLILLKFLKLDK